MVATRFLENVCVRACVRTHACFSVYMYVGACVCREGWGLVGIMHIM